MNDRTLIRTGAVGAVVAAICCATPVLAVALGALGLSAWAAKADYVLIPVLLGSVVLVGVGLYRRRRTDACCEAGGGNARRLKS